MANSQSDLFKLGQQVRAELDLYATKVSLGNISSEIGDTRADSYSEPTFTSGVLQSITTWTNSGKGTKVGSKAFTYTNGNLTSVVEKDGSDATTLTKTLTYDAEGNLASITKDYA